MSRPGNFCTVDPAGSSRLAGRSDNTDACRVVPADGQDRMGGGVQTFVPPVREHRFALVLRSPGLSDQLADSDPADRRRAEYGEAICRRSGDG